MDGGNKRRAICFSNSKGKLLLEKKKNRTAVKISRFNLAKDSETIYINDMTYISKPRPEEYSFQFQENFASTSGYWISMKDAIEQCEAMTLVNIIKMPILQLRYETEKLQNVCNRETTCT